MSRNITTQFFSLYYMANCEWSPVRQHRHLSETIITLQSMRVGYINVSSLATCLMDEKYLPRSHFDLSRRNVWDIVLYLTL